MNLVGEALVGEAIAHKVFGKGIVSNVNSQIIEVDFFKGRKKFVFPDAFRQFISLMDSKYEKDVQSILDEIDTKNKKETQKARIEDDRLRRIGTLKIKPKSQVAFGFLENNYEDVLKSWSLFTGSYLTGQSKGKPRIPNRLDLNSACLLTMVPDGLPEKERIIFGVFMVPDDFYASNCTDGIIEAHEKYRLTLDIENEKIRFWDYFPSDTPTFKWGGMEMKYFSNDIMHDVLYHMKEIIKDPDRQETISSLYSYFCKINSLKIPITTK